MSVVRLNESNFDTETSTGTTLVDFYADWCGPCKAMSGTPSKFQSETGVQLVKINVDQNRELAQQYGVRGIPCFVVVNDGAEVGRAVGVQTLQQLKDLTI